MSEEKKQQKNTTFMTGEVVSDKMKKTIVVRAIRRFTHPLYKKTVMTHKKFKVDDADEQARVGDYVEFYVGAPVSKEKCMHLHKILKRASSI